MKHPMITTPALDSNTRTVILRMIRLLYPHDAIPDHVYAEVLNRALASNSALHEMVVNAEKALDAQQQQR